MRQNLPAAVQLILVHEGGYVDDPKDPGGCTNYGITIATYRKHIDPEGSCDDLRAMHKNAAENIYGDTYWGAVKADNLPPGVDLSVFDFGVNAGPARAARMLQRLVGTAQDGKIGPITLAAVWDADGEKLIRDYAHARIRYYRSLRHWSRFGRGWTRRTLETEAKSLELHVGQREALEVDD